MALPGEHVKALDELRSRLSRVIVALESAHQHLATNDPLPTWPELQEDASAIGNAMLGLTEVLNSQRELFSTLHPYPTSSFPAYDPQQQALLFALLWKKLEPRGEEWIDKSLQDSTDQNGTADMEALSSDQMEELWGWAERSGSDMVKELFSEGVFDDDFTMAERESEGGVEKVVTGLKRDLSKEDDEDDDEDEDDEMDEDLPSAIPLDSLLRFGSGAEMDPRGPDR